ncbi:MAG: SH3 domain-containing protein, partial [Thermomicrobiaceae bacterium]|nr:SH3 domain-containing protein [Thermomicrobiaceae bacterium]
VGVALALSALAPTLAAAAPAAPPAAPPSLAPADNPFAVTFHVFATREGLVGHTTANGHVIQPNDHFVALPCTCALSSKDGSEFQVKLSYKGRTAIAPVWDVGPWNTHDNYWDSTSARTWPNITRGIPEAAAAYFNGYNGGKDERGRTVTAPFGLDIADGTWADLGMTGNDWVDVTFLWVHPPLSALPPLPPGFEGTPTVWEGQRPPLDPVAQKAGYAYFSITGHNVRPELKAYWDTHGGLRNIGLPLTELFREVRADGTVRLVQYFERQILELTPPPSDKPLVMSDLVGYTAVAPSAARAKIPPFPNNADHWYFPQTGHSLSYGFKEEWRKHGGLAAYGYPITEEFSAVTPSGRRYVAQLFERGRFEWWPDKVGTGAEITHGLLVTERLRAQGWLR